MKNEHWIQGDLTCESPLFRRSFQIDKPINSAYLEICGLGFFHVYVNGIRVNTEEMIPAFTNYTSIFGHHTTYPVFEERAEFRTGYLTYDLTPYLTQGENVLGVHLGNGWYHQTRRTAEGDFVFGFPKLHYELTITQQNGSQILLESDDKTLWTESEIIENNLFYGETHDLRRRKADWSAPNASLDGWRPANKSDAPKTQLMKQDCPTDQIVRTIDPILIFQSDDRRIYDCGENITGWVDAVCDAAYGQQVRIRYSENLSPDKTALDFRSTGGEEQIQADQYICAETPVSVRPQFCWHGFRYFELTGPATPKKVSVVHTAIPVTSSFSCSNPVLNWLYDAYIRTQLNNIHGCIPSDCPHRERLGYTGDGQITAEAAMMMLDPTQTKRMYEKWMQDILDSRGAVTGHIPHTAPFMGGGGGPGGWGGAIFIVPMAYYQVYGDNTLLKICYPHILKWLDYMESHSEDHLVVREEDGGWCLGDWCPPPSMNPPDIPPAFVNTYYYIKGMRCALKASHLLGVEVPEWLPTRLSTVEKSWVAHYFDPQTGSFCNGLCGADAFALDIGLGTAQTRSNLIRKYKDIGCLDTGIFGTPILIETLFREGEATLAYDLLTRRTDASFARMMESGATTLWETWSGDASHDHPMFGAVAKLLFTEILGIRQTKDNTGYTQYDIAPADIVALSWAKGHLTTCHGTIQVEWKRDSEGHMQVHFDDIPSLDK